MQNTKIVAIGNDLEMPDDGVTIYVKDKWATPFIIDVHSHLGVHPAHVEPLIKTVTDQPTL